MYGLLRSAAEYLGPVLAFESKGLYRMTLGDAFLGEPTDPKEIAALKRSIGFGGHIPDPPDDFRVPLGKAALRRPGKDITVVTWGRCTLFCGEGGAEARGRGRRRRARSTCARSCPTTARPSWPACASTGRLLIVHEDRVFASLGREIQGAVQEAMTGEHVITRVLGQDPSPGIPSPIEIEEQIVVSPEKVHAAVLEVMSIRRAKAAADAAAPARPGARQRRSVRAPADLVDAEP